MTEDPYEYKGRCVLISVTEHKKNSFSWACSIDGEHFFTSDGRRLRSRAVVVAEAKSEANNRIDRME